MAIPSDGASFGELIDSETFREVMRLPISSVVVVATGGGDSRAGCTVTAVCSLSDSPPSLLVCLNRRSAAHGAVLAHGRFSANYLHDSQVGIANVFAGRSGLQGHEKFDGDEWFVGSSGVPQMKEALAVLTCEIAQVVEFGTHSIICAKISRTQVRTDARPLLYGSGGYLSATAAAMGA